MTAPLSPGEKFATDELMRLVRSLESRGMRGDDERLVGELIRLPLRGFLRIVLRACYLKVARKFIRTRSHSEA